jgi:hypothetical protein
MKHRLDLEQRQVSGLYYEVTFIATEYNRLFITPSFSSQFLLLEFLKSNVSTNTNNTVS